MAKARRRDKAIRKAENKMDRLRLLVADRERRDLQSATPERLVRAGGDVEIGADKVQRLSDAPLERLFKRQQLHTGSNGRRGQRDLNGIFYEAGRRFRAAWHRVRWIRYAHGTTNSHFSLPHDVGVPRHFQSEAIYKAREEHRQAVSSLGTYFGEVVEAVICHEMPLEIAGRQVTGRSHAKTNAAVALDRLREALRLLAIHYKMVS